MSLTQTLEWPSVPDAPFPTVYQRFLPAIRLKSRRILAHPEDAEDVAHDSFVRLLPKSGGAKIAVAYADIAALAFTGRDMAAGKGWENWVRQYWEKKVAGEKNISLHPEELE